MRTATNFILLVIISALFFSCQKEFTVTQTPASVSTGNLIKDAGGNCLPVNINGIYKVNTQLSSTHYMDVSVNVVSVGSYVINTDTINGIHFRDSAQFNTTGVQVVRLMGYGNPVNAGLFSFTARYNNSSWCSVALTVIPAGGSTAASFTLVGAPGSCTTPLINGTYTVGTALTAANKIDISINVSVPGTYTLSTVAVNGFSFSAAGTFTISGPQTVSLSGSGTPVNSGITTMSVSGAPAACSFTINVDPVTVTGNKIKRIIQSITGTRQAYITTLTYDAGNRLLTFKEWKEDSAFTPIKITSSKYSSFTYNGATDYPIKNTITHEVAGTDSTLYSYDAMNRVTKEDWYYNGQVTVRNVYAYLSSTVVLLSKYVLMSTLQLINTDSLIFDSQNRITEIRSYNASNVFAGIHTYQYDNKNNPFFLVNLFKHAFTLYADDAKYFYRAPNNFVNYNQTTFPSGSTTVVANYTLYNSALFPLSATGSITNVPGSTENFTMRFEYY